MTDRSYLRVIVVDIQHGDVEGGCGVLDAIRNPDGASDEASRLSIQRSSGYDNVVVNRQLSCRRHVH